MGDDHRTRHPWGARARRRTGALTLAGGVVAVTGAAVVLLLVLGPAAAVDRSGAVTDRTTARAAVAVAGALDGVAVAVLGVLTLVTLAVLAARLHRLRSDEDALFTARGATRWQLLRWDAVEGALVAGGGAALGVGVVWLVLAAATRTSAHGLATVAVAVLVAAVVSGAVVSAVGSSASGPRTAGSASGVTVGPVVAPAVLVAAAAFSTWRLFTAGVPVRADRTSATVDVVAAAAPVVWVLAGSAVVVLLGGVAARVVARRAERWAGLLPAVTARRTARRWASAAPTVLVVGVVVALGVFVAGFAATVGRVDDRTAEAVVGTDVRVRFDGDPAVGVGTGLPRVRVESPGAGRSAAVWTDTAGIGAVQAPVIGVDGRDAPAVFPGAAGNALRATAGATRAGVPLRASDRRVTVDVRAATATVDEVPRPDASGTVRFAAWVVAADGVPALLPLTASGDPTATTRGSGVPTGGSARLAADLPTTDSGWRLLAVEPTLSFSSRPEDVDTAGTGPPLRVGVTVTVHGADGAVTGHADAVDLAPPPRVVLGHTPGSGRLPVVLTRTLADRLDVDTGAHLDLTPASTSTPVAAVVSAVVPEVPGSASRSAVATDLTALVATTIDGGTAGAGSAVPRVDERWITTTEPSAVADALRTGLPAGTTVTTGADVRSAPVIATAVSGLAVVAALGALFVTLVLAAAGAGADSARRVLRAAGVPARASAAARGAGLALPVVAGVVGGAVTGLFATATTVAPFAVAAVPAARGLVDATPVLTSGWAALAPVVVLACTAGVVGSVVARGRRPEGTP
ncbi:hypothetical protein [Curtobacterium sp. 9128]|uniref:hypothetical protein n=1 Tax=Curtobacterium sp. 9128 TaxID=1793722 RepID=UPI00119FB5C9|nr:hypothetical protein [Curtobacterium sp. 9128]